MLYYALFYATHIPTVVYAQVVGDEEDNEPMSMGDEADLDTMDLSDFPWCEESPCSNLTAAVSAIAKA